MSEQPFLSIRDVAEQLDRTPTRVYQLIAGGEIPAVRVGGRIRVPRRAFDAWLEQKNELALAAARSA